MSARRIGPGRPLPPGATPDGGGCNFSLFSRHATGVSLLLFEPADAAAPSVEIGLDPDLHRTGDLWHVYVAGVGPGIGYAYRVDGPCAPGRGLHFDPRRLVVDPRAPALHGAAAWDLTAARRGCDAPGPAPTPPARTARGVVVEDRFDWGGSRRPRHPWWRTVIYETHVRGATRHPSAGVAQPGTYAGLIEKIPYLRELGVTAVELLPVQAFDPNGIERRNPLTGARLQNYWGYDPIGFFAPHEEYAAGDAVEEFKTLVRALHAAGIELFLDVVFNHSAEGGADGPTLSMRGIDNPIYYLLDPADPGRYLDFTGCGNTLNCNHPVLREFILDCLRHWATAMQVDGFRFDLASVLGRDRFGNILANPPLLELIAEDPVLRDVKLIAEAWDAGGAYQVGSFPGRRWSEWNGCYRDDVRRFWRGERGLTGRFASRLAGSADLYQKGDRSPVNSVNFVTCHDGFTLNDLVSYARKHNEANGEDNRDGAAENFSDNCGVEGPSPDPQVEAMRARRIRNFIATLMLSRGVPMLLGGDEFRRTQGGNNNAYCHDDETSWYDWSLALRNADLVRFTRGMIRLRHALPMLSHEAFYAPAELGWFGESGAAPDWAHGDPVLGAHFHPPGATPRLCALFNAAERTAAFTLPEGPWWIVADTSAPAPGDIRLEAPSALPAGGGLTLAPGSLTILLSAASIPG